MQAIDDVRGSDTWPLASITSSPPRPTLFRSPCPTKPAFSVLLLLTATPFPYPGFQSTPTVLPVSISLRLPPPPPYAALSLRLSRFPLHLHIFQQLAAFGWLHAPGRLSLLLPYRSRSDTRSLSLRPAQPTSLGISWGPPSLPHRNMALKVRQMGVYLMDSTWKALLPLRPLPLEGVYLMGSRSKPQLRRPFQQPSRRLLLKLNRWAPCLKA